MDGPLDLLFLTQTYPRHEDDTAGPFIRDLARALVAGGDRVTVLAPHTRSLPARGVEQGVELRTFRYAPAALEVLGYGRTLEADERVRTRAALAAPLYALGLRRSLRALVRLRRFDWVHAHWIVPNGIVAATGLRARSGGAGGAPAFALGLHGSDVFMAEKWWLRAPVGRALRRARLVTSCSPELLERVQALGNTRDPAPRAGAVIPYGVDATKFAPEAGARSRWRTRLGILEPAVVALGVGRMATKKGFSVLMAALPPVLASCPDLHVVLAGEGDLLPELRERAAPFGRRVHLPGAVERDALPDLYRAADLFVLPAVHDRNRNVDGLPNVILEAMASGLPVLASAISGIPLAVVSEEHGVLVPEGDVSALGEALVALVRDRARRVRLGSAARQRVLP